MRNAEFTQPKNGPSPPPTSAGGPVAKPEISTADRLRSRRGRAGPGWVDEKLVLIGRTLLPGLVDEMGGWGRSRLQPASPQGFGLGAVPSRHRPQQPGHKSLYGFGLQRKSNRRRRILWFWTRSAINATPWCGYWRPSWAVRSPHRIPLPLGERRLRISLVGQDSNLDVTDRSPWW